MIKRRVALGCTSGHDYSTFLPFACLLWRDRIDYEPSVFLVGTDEEWEHQPRTVVVLNELRHLGFHVEFVDHIQGVEDGTIAQCVRQHAAAFDYDPEDVLMPSDADLLPIGRGLYWTHDPDRFAIGLIYSNAYPGEECHYASCHMSLKVKTWREIMGLDIPMKEAMIRNFSEYGLGAKMEAKRVDAKRNWGQVWFTDELVASRKIQSSKYYPSQVQMIPREGHPPRDRLDRSAWPAKYDVTQYTDVHSIRPI